MLRYRVVLIAVMFALTMLGAAPAFAVQIDWGDGSSTEGVRSGGTVYGSHTYAAAYAYLVRVTVADRYGSAVLASASGPASVPATAEGTVGGTVPATLEFAVGSANFGTFVPGVARDYTTTAAASATSTAGEAVLSVTGGRLTNGELPLSQPLRARADTSTAFLPVSSTPVTLLSYSGPVSNAPASIELQQSIGATEPLRTGAYATTLVFTLSTSTP